MVGAMLSITMMVCEHVAEFSLPHESVAIAVHVRSMV